MNKISHLEKLQETLQEIFLKNISFFKKEFPLVYKKIIDFENLKTENYSIDFINDEFQLTNIKDQTKYYEIEPFSDSINRLNKFDISCAFSLIKLEKLPKRNHYESEINSYEYLNEYINNFENINIEVNKFIFIGTLFGIHINDFHKSLNSKVYLIIEPNIEIFRLSMFFCDYTSLSDSKLFFAIGENEITLKNVVNEFLNFKYEYNNLIFYELAHKINESLISQLSSQFTLNGQMRYPFSEFLISLKRGYKYFFEDKKRIINLSKKHKFLEDKKVLFLGAGLSLAKNLEWLYLNQEKFVVVASSAVLKHLRILNIVPDIILAIDGQKEQMLNQFDVEDIMYKNSIILASIKLDCELFLKLKNSNLFFMQDSLELFENFGFLEGVTVGDLGVEILTRLGAKDIYLLGVDASLDSKTGKTHIGTHKSSRKINLNKKDNGDFREGIIYIKGNLEDKVPTFREYLDMKDSIENIIFKNKNILNVYNFGSGAYFIGSFPIKIEDYKNEFKIEKNSFIKEFFNNLNNISKDKLEVIDIKDIQKEKKILKKLNNLKIENFYSDFKIIFKNYPNSVVANIFDRFFRLVLPYKDILKNQDISNEILEKQIKEVLNAFNSIFDRINVNL
ncbi:6-hydroxymethylpterin diphosphokinase MptE-like protein [Aliarcobacter butzleri]|uniref:6-hydroxymethylpterin diphosphokinase MptE-like protein n=1 Tax=Aliarcobacter butzleri TaxID=28197 RepID=UPI003AF60F06